MSIEVRHVTKTFGNFRALDDVNLKVNDGQLVALLGPSGSGKTTLLRVIGGLETPDLRDDTAILFHDRDVADQHVSQRQVGFVFQHYALFKHLTVLENIAFGLRVRPRSTRPSDAEIRHRVRQLLKLVQLEGIERRYPSQLSGGQRQRVALARALAVEPRVLLLDEPFGALDAKVRTELRRWLRRLHDEIHVTSIFVTHDQEEALEVADRVVVMNRGRIEQVGSADDVFHYPANEFVMDFLGNVNLFHCRMEQGKAVFGVTDLGLEEQSGGQTVRMFVRPHDFDILTQADHRPAMRARVVRIQSAGSMVKLELLGDVGGPFYAEIPHDRFKLLCLSPGSIVYASPRDAKVFVEDYQI